MVRRVHPRGCSPRKTKGRCTLGFPVPNSGSGDQPSTERSAAQEAEAAANIDAQTPASGLPGDEPRVPLSRLNKVLQEVKELKEQLGSQQPTAPAGGQPDFDREIAKWKQLAAQKVDDPVAYADAMAQISQLSSQAAVTGALGQFMQEQRAQQQQERAETTAKSAWDQALAEFPDLADTNSAFYKAAAAEFELDPDLHANPKGSLYAARSAALKLGQAGRPDAAGAGLEAGGPNQLNIKDPAGDRIEAKKAARDATMRGNKYAAAEYLQRRFRGEI